MPKKRDRIQIIEDMLTAVINKGGEIKPTHLMYKSNLSHGQMTGYLDELMEKGFLERVQKKKSEMIAITERGLRFMNKIREMKAFEKSFGLDDE